MSSPASISPPLEAPDIAREAFVHAARSAGRRLRVPSYRGRLVRIELDGVPPVL